MHMRRGALSISLIVPNRDGEATIGHCLTAAVPALRAGDEIIVVDDGSTDGSAELISRHRCRLIRLDRRCGASAARNIGALASNGDIVLFIDADCIVQPDTLALVEQALAGHESSIVVGGTYTPEPADSDFFSRFQSIFIHHAETRRPHAPDYIAGHAMAMRRSTFLRSGGFPERFLPIIEDVEFSHRLRRQGCALVMHPEIQVRHIFNFSLKRSFRNAFRKTRYWIRYSLMHQDLLEDSGTASRGLKLNVAAWAASLAAAWLAAITGHPLLLGVIPFLSAASGIANRGLIRAWWRTGGPGFGSSALAYYLLVYPGAVALGAAAGLAEHIAGRDRPFLGQRKAQKCEERAYPTA
jgi:GT2 family glycosyltransferase